jgi:archaellum component FlaC
MTDSNVASQADLNHFYSKISTTFESFERYFEDQVKLIEARLEAIDKQIATLVVGYAEQAIFIDALMSQLENEPTDKQDAFRAKVQELRKTMMSVLDYTSDVLEDRATDIAGSMENMATPNQA